MGGPDQRLGLALMANFRRMLGERDLGRIRDGRLVQRGRQAGGRGLPRFEGIETITMVQRLYRISFTESLLTAIPVAKTTVSSVTP